MTESDIDFDQNDHDHLTGPHEKTWKRNYGKLGEIKQARRKLIIISQNFFHKKRVHIREPQ